MSNVSLAGLPESLTTRKGKQLKYNLSGRPTIVRSGPSCRSDSPSASADAEEVEIILLGVAVCLRWRLCTGKKRQHPRLSLSVQGPVMFKRWQHGRL